MQNRPPANQDSPAGPGPSSLQEQLAAAYDTCAASLYRCALMITADHSAAEDAVQQVFAKLAARGGGVSDIASRNGYLRSAVRNECYRILRRRSQAGTANLESEAILEPVDRQAVDAEQQRAIERALRSLPAEQREVVHMKVYEHMTFQRIADDLGISINTVASRYRYATDKLRTLLAAYWRTEGHQDD